MKKLIVWLTGLPCSGKTTLAEIIADRIGAELLDGDVLRDSNFSKGVGFSPEGRKQHLLRVGYLAERLSKYNHVICSFVSPNEEVRQQLPVDLMVYVACPVEICAKRDVKGMYAKAAAGEIKNFTGVGASYEKPEMPDLIVHTDKADIETCVTMILAAMDVFTS